MFFDHRPPQNRDAICFALLFFNNWIALTTSLPSAAAITEIVKDQIEVPTTAQSALQILKATNIVGDEIYYLASVGTDSTGASTTVFLDTEAITTATNVAGSTVVGVPLALEISATSTTTLVPTTAISTVLSTPPTVAFTTVDTNGNQIVDIGQEFVRGNGSTFTAVLLSNVSTTSATTVNAQGSTVVQTVAVLTAENGSTVTDTLSFANPDSASTAAEDAFVLMVKSAIQQGIAGNPTTAATNVQQGVDGQPISVASFMSSARSLNPSSNTFQTSQITTNPTAGFQSGSITSSVLSKASKIFAAGSQNTDTLSNVLSTTGNQSNGTSASLISGGILLFAASEAAATIALSALLVAQLPILTTIPSGMTVETATSTKCTTAGAMVTTTEAGSTTTEIVPKLCAGGFAFFLFGTPKLPQLCKERFSLFGFLLQFICDPQTDKIPVGFDLISYDPDSPDAPGNSDGPGSPGNPNDPAYASDPDDPDNSPDQDRKGTVSLPSQSGSITFTTSGLSAVVSSRISSSTSKKSSFSTVISSRTSSSPFNTSSLSTAVSSRVYSSASSEPTGNFVDIFYDLITASVPIPAYATGIPGLGMGSPITAANASLDSLFSTLAVNVTSWLAAYSALSIAKANGIAGGQFNRTTVNSSCVKTT